MEEGSKKGGAPWKSFATTIGVSVVVGVTGVGVTLPLITWRESIKNERRRLAELAENRLLDHEGEVTLRITRDQLRAIAEKASTDPKFAKLLFNPGKDGFQR